MSAWRESAYFVLAVVSYCALSWPFSANAQPFSFDDIEFWVGSGANRAALVIDWFEDSTDPPALVWGHRWDGTAQSSDMLTAIVAADPRFVAKLGGAPGDPNALYGLGFDADNDNNDEDFKLAERDDMGQVVAITMPFDQDGFVYTGPADGEEALDDDSDYYAEGWFGGFWHYGIASSNPYDGGSWSDTLLDMSSRVLNDGAWDSWAFTPTFDFSAFAENPVAAAPPYSPGDFNYDGEVTTADYDVWTATFGSTTELTADANGDRTVDAADYIVWRKHFTATLVTNSSLLVVPVPETASATSWIVTIFGSLAIRFRKSPQMCADKRRYRRSDLRSSAHICGCLPIP